MSSWGKAVWKLGGRIEARDGQRHRPMAKSVRRGLPELERTRMRSVGMLGAPLRRRLEGDILHLDNH